MQSLWPTRESLCGAIPTSVFILATAGLHRPLLSPLHLDPVQPVYLPSPAILGYAWTP